MAISQIFEHFHLEIQDFLLSSGDRQKVNCPKGKRGHPGVHQSEDWFAMTCVFLRFFAFSVALGLAEVSLPVAVIGFEHPVIVGVAAVGVGDDQDRVPGLQAVQLHDGLGIALHAL